MDLPGDGSPRDLPVKCPRKLPEFSELCSVPSAAAAAAAIAAISTVDSRGMQSQGIQTTETQAVMSPQEASMNSFSKLFTMPPLSWQESLFHLVDKQLLNQIITVPSYNQSNNGTHSAQCSNFNFVNNLAYLPSTSQIDIVKQEPDIQFKEENNSDKETDMLIKQHQTAITEYMQKSKFSLWELCEQVKKEKLREEKVEHSQNNILNIPNVRNIYLQNGNFANSNQITVTVNPNDLNLQNEQEVENSLRNVVKVEQQVQTDLPRIEKKSKFRAKLGEIKVSFNYDGTPLYYCPECSLALPDKAEVEQHIQGHLQERKYQCKECGAMLKRKEHLDQHMRGHSNERPYKCELCKRAFKRNEHLTRHAVIHSGNKDFSCNMCPKAFSRKDHLNKHIQTHLGIRKNKMKDESYFVEQKDSARVFDNNIDIATAPKQDVSGYVLKDGNLLKQETALLQHLQNIQKNPALLHTFASLKEHMKDVITTDQAQNSNGNENSRYTMSS